MRFDWIIPALVGVGLLVGVLVLLLRFVVVRKLRADVMMPGRVMGVVGRMGGGKTSWAVGTALEVLDAGGRVAANFPIEYPDSSRVGLIEDLEQLALAESCLVILDEAHLWAPSSHSQRFPMAARKALSDARKRGVAMIWIAQHESRVNRTLVDLTSDMVLCRSNGRGRVRLEFYAVEDFRKASKKPWLVIRRRLSKRVMQAYDTRALIELDSHVAGL